MCTLKYLMVMPDIQKAKCFEFTVQILPPALGGGGGKKIITVCETMPPPRFISYTPLKIWQMKLCQVGFSLKKNFRQRFLLVFAMKQLN